ncbi:alpha/beta hydrolase [Kribbella sp.]|uniref:alpha/beta hydrolase n=1 Tax=Kribbella sp. TaxID=1871183 RepID=UPI002D3E4E4B|nr:alpha/beta hydrolase [Kribbella sp.]HZX08807.1 alpha/beta hydrolase [Kribbella sp.]
MSMTWIVVPGLAEAPEEFGQVVELLPDEDLRVIDPWRTPITSDVDALRAAACVPPGVPVGLIGHSIGGLAVLRWALTRPGEVSRLVLVDSSLPSETGWQPFHRGQRGDQATRSVVRFLGQVGVPQLVGTTVRRLSVRLGSTSNRDPLSGATAKERYGGQDSWLRFWDELAGSWPLAAEVAELLARPIDNIPPTTLLVATGGMTRFTAKSWLTGQQKLAATLNASLEVLPDSEHLVQLDRPDAIAAAVRK